MKNIDITLKQISKSWSDTRVLSDVSITIPGGQFTILLGPSGCGKTTLLRLISGLETVDSGEIWAGDVNITHHPAEKRNLSFVFQSYALFPHLSVRENILFGLKTRRVARNAMQERLVEVADLLGIGALLDRKPAQLSGGQQQRVALGRALISRRPICLMDEPLSNLDAKLRQSMRKELRDLQKSIGFTMIYVTHDQAEAMSMADHVALMNQGHIEQFSSPKILYARPETEFVARFIGSPAMNVVTADALGH